MNYERIKVVLELVTQIIPIVGVPTAIFVYIQTKRKKRQEREYLAYDSLDAKHIEFLNLCLQNADLNLYWGNDIDLNTISDEEKGGRQILYEILVTNIERAFLLYRNQSRKIRSKQWEGWNKYAIQWMEVKNFRDSWQILTDGQFDLDFLAYMNEIYQQALRNKTVVIENPKSSEAKKNATRVKRRKH